MSEWVWVLVAVAVFEVIMAVWLRALILDERAERRKLVVLRRDTGALVADVLRAYRGDPARLPAETVAELTNGRSRRE